VTVPIRESEKARYPADWPEIRERIRARAGDKCEWCEVANGALIDREGWGKYVTLTGPLADLEEMNDGKYYVRVVCTTAHLNHTPEDCRDENLAFLCQKCHNGYDAAHRAAGIKERRDQIPGQQSLLHADTTPADSKEG
jgi:hypothetical protein